MTQHSGPTPASAEPPATGGGAPSGAGPQPAPAYAVPPALPTQAGPLGITYDFNNGVRVGLPRAETPWRVRLSDLDTDNILFEAEVAEGFVTSSKRYHLRARIEVWRDGQAVFAHDFSAADRPVLIQLPVGTLGDSLGWLPYAARFQEAHGCRLTCTVAPWLVPLLAPAYPQIRFLTPAEVTVADYYATYVLGLFFDDKDTVQQPCDFRLVGLHRTAGYILGVDPAEEPPRIAIDPGGRPIAEPYVCIAVQSSSQCKYWNNPTGWREVVAFLKGAGYRVVCIDQKPVHGHDLVWTHIPYGAEDQTGDRPLSERARWLKHADFFVGLSSGLSWLAWAAGTPVVMISGFTHPTNEFHTPYRVVNYHACNSCWNDPAVRFDHADFLWCPRHKGTPRHFECTRLISANQVKAAIARIPGFRDRVRP
ncbi:autotransporter strand-loop-strand O-heptosyltransferase [Novispirillum sp. DQ9]|uniref:autotransporter strand-loop-strand O-heptosyltransferase n=1 Tax=Novispirillum sp. DQ9 TaxID=3398612 RepID=UPI003C7D7D77